MRQRPGVSRPTRARDQKCENPWVGISRAFEESGRVYTAAKVKAYRIYADLAWDAGVRVLDACDAHSDEIP
jgi:hypothetical protein